MADIKELQSKMAAAIAANDIKAIEAIAQEIVKSKGERAKAEAAAAVKEQEALAGVRQELAESIRKTIDKAIPDLAKQLKGVKCDEFRYQAKGKLDVNGVPFEKSIVGLNVPVVKAHKAGAGGGAGKTKDEFGMSLSEVFEKYATATDREDLAAAEVKDVAASAKLGRQTNSNAWRVKATAKKRFLAEGQIAPVK